MYSSLRCQVDKNSTTKVFDKIALF